MHIIKYISMAAAVVSIECHVQLRYSHAIVRIIFAQLACDDVEPLICALVIKRAARGYCYVISFFLFFFTRICTISLADTVSV